MKLFILIFFSSIILLSNANNENSNNKNNHWDHIYSRDRLVIFKDTMKVTGVVKSIHGGFDGDLHINLKLDSGLNHLLNENNLNTEDSCLVLELICVNKSIFSECKGYRNSY